MAYPMRRRNVLDPDEWLNKWVQRKDACLPKVKVLSLTSDTDFAAYDQVPAALAKAGRRASVQWLWCLHCGRFFQAKHLELDILGNWQQCPFYDCGAAGFDIDIFSWKYGLHEAEWPRSVRELHFGLCMR
ncbi:MAG: hypothetical protein JRH20_11325 [Deltaproteobacteria bacterium]|nr:hypothetical protein [Deltaproteobacteria bacterium]